MAESETTPRRVAFEVDSDSEDLESVESDMTSLTSSIYNYVYENGRTYHSYRPGAYILPNDEREQERLDLLHHVFRLCLDGRLCRTELTNPQKILDVGTGTGIWAIEVADDYPSAEVVGVDLSPIQPGWVAPNLRFFIDDVSQEWTFPSNSFDFIHVRCLSGSLTDWPTFLKHCYRHLKPGGKIELAECRTQMNCDDETYPEGCHTYKWVAEFNRISHANGRVFDLFPQFKGLLGDAAFTNIQVHQEVCPIGTWPKDSRLKEIGRYFRAQFLWGGVEAYSMALFTRFGGWSPEEVEVLLAEVRREVNGNKMHIYTHCSFTTAEKPRN
ncbi:class I SAM-dependent methyltransferase [Aspergillus alliaceus]|uniref:class I SAM-dependent methyltransferase n=1 Tax=Petromyces alliaceus TaxID=209559 RepID=UPI0012A5AA2C|nr:S-adenosyl-L-methionine-dependent methyltransferase [Aspergillus alliaceus]KAB8236661.1 S-adenosyl-L-methionine-dependent methyltransferase [Aspergillus alliaceus]